MSNNKDSDWEDVSSQSDWEDVSASRPMFSSIEEAKNAMHKQAVEQIMAENNVRGFMPYLKAGTDFASNAMPIVSGVGIGNAASKLLGPGLMNTVKAGIAGGITSGAMTNVDKPSERTNNMLSQASIGAAVPIGISGIGKGASSISKIPKAAESFNNVMRALPIRASNSKSAEFARDIRSAYIRKKTDIVDKWGEGLDNLVKKEPNKLISIGEDTGISDIITDPNLNNETRNIINKTPILKDIISGKRKDNVNVKEIQNIINYINDKVPSKIKSSNMDLLDLLSELRVAQSKAFPEEMSKLRSEYSKVINPFKDIKQYMRFNQTINAIDNDFGGPEGVDALNRLFKDDPDILKKIGAFKVAGKLLRRSKQAAVATAIGKGAQAAGMF